MNCLDLADQFACTIQYNTIYPLQAAPESTTHPLNPLKSHNRKRVILKMVLRKWSGMDPYRIGKQISRFRSTPWPSLKSISLTDWHIDLSILHSSQYIRHAFFHLLHSRKPEQLNLTEIGDPSSHLKEAIYSIHQNLLLSSVKYDRLLRKQAK